MNTVNALANEWSNSSAGHCGRQGHYSPLPDAAEITCLNLHNGRLVWKNRAPPTISTSPAFTRARRVVVGKNRVLAYKLTDGTKVWDSSEATGTPTSQVVAAGSTYYLPARNASKEPEIVTINLADGKVTGHPAEVRQEGPAGQPDLPRQLPDLADGQQHPPAFPVK